MRRRGFYKTRHGGGVFYAFAGVLLVAALFLAVFEIRLRPIVASAGEIRAKALVERTINDAVINRLRENEVKYDDLVTLKKDNRGQIAALASNIVGINRLKAELGGDITRKLGDERIMSASLPIGSLMNNSFLSGYGPRIKFRVVPFGCVIIDIKNNFSAAGINQTKHEIFLEVSAEVAIIIPGGQNVVSVKTNIPVAQTVIVGEVPNTYTNIEGVAGTAADTGVILAPR